MHLAEGTLPLPQVIGWTVTAVPILVWSIRGEALERRRNPESSTLISAVTSILFAATLLPLPVPVVGATSHICLTPLFALVLGLRRIIWPVFFILLLQALFFAHGGITTLGINTLTLGLFGPLTTVVFWSVMGRLGVKSSLGLGIVCAIGGLSVYIVDALVLGFALSELAEVSKTFWGVLMGFAPVQIPLVVLEAFISVKIVQLLLERRPDLLPNGLTVMKPSTINVPSVLLFFFVSILSGCTYKGIDETVFGAAAEQAGQPPVDSLIDFSQGEMGLATSILILFGFGFVSGLSWHRLFSGNNDAV